MTVTLPGPGQYSLTVGVSMKATVGQSLHVRGSGLGRSLIYRAYLMLFNNCRHGRDCLTLLGRT